MKDYGAIKQDGRSRRYARCNNEKGKGLPVTILPGLIDKKLRCGRYRGEVLRLGGKRRDVLAVVYGDTIEEMRRREYAVAKLMEEIERETG